MKRLAVLAILLTGCVPPPQQGNPLSTIAGFTITDLQNAEADAVANGDELAIPCYPALIRFVQSIQPNQPTATVSGAFGTFQKARDVTLVAGGGIPNYVKVGCAALFIDNQVLIARLAGIVGTTIVTGAPPPIGTTVFVP